MSLRGRQESEHRDHEYIPRGLVTSVNKFTFGKLAVTVEDGLEGSGVRGRESN